MEIEHWGPDELVPYTNNPRVNEHVVDEMAEAIKTFGFRVPIIARTGGEIVDGHLRLKAARKLNLESVPVIRADDLTDDQIKALRLSINKLAELADWDDSKLMEELEALANTEIDLSSIGFNDDELSLLYDNWKSDIDLPERDGETDEGLTPHLKVYVDKDSIQNAKALIVKALNDASIDHEFS